MGSPAVTLDFSKQQPLDSGQGQSPASSGVTLNFDQAQPISVSMVGPDGSKQQVPVDQVTAMRQKNFAVTPDNPGVVKAVDYNNGRVNYVLPQEVEAFHNAGNAIVQPDGSIRYPIIRDKNGVIFQDPLEEQQAHQRVYAALDADEKARNRSSELKDFAKAGIHATIDTALGVTGAGGLGAAPEAATTGLQFLGRAALPGLEEEAGKALLKQGAKWAVKKAAPYVIGGAALHAAKKTGLLDTILDWF